MRFQTIFTEEKGNNTQSSNKFLNQLQPWLYYSNTINTITAECSILVGKSIRDIVKTK